ncbi:MAG TPA: ATP-binding protein [Syntrophorhabdaceae bacterium]|nr:ATP-binding protein [Syntrophorhabdaceae bacterium]
MKAKLEDVLREKERELKLHKRFLHLRALCEQEVFAGSNLPLRPHVETLKDVLEQLIPDPKERGEEMFSGEIFALLGALYLHDIGLTKTVDWCLNKEILEQIDDPGKQIFLNYEIGKKLRIPESAIEIINDLVLAHTVTKIPSEWEIVDEGSKALIRSPRTLAYLFNFAHLLVDMFYSDMRYLALKRYGSPQIILKPHRASIGLDANAGVITIRYGARFPYELHAIENARRYVENMFVRFKNEVNGRMGFQYKKIVWEIALDSSFGRNIPATPKLSAYSEFEEAPIERWEEANAIIDRLFDHGHALIVGDASVGKTTVLKSFVISQLMSMVSNVFYCEMWSHPTGELRNAIGQKPGPSRPQEFDIVSACKELLEEGPCFFVIDSVERLVSIDAKEIEKFERFLDFCRKEKNIYVIICGDKETFFGWQRFFDALHGPLLLEIKTTPPHGTSVGSHDTPHYKPIECELLQANLDPARVIDDLFQGFRDSFEFRSIMAHFIDGQQGLTERYSVEEIFYETALPQETIARYMETLTEKDILKKTETLDGAYYSLSSRYFKEPIHTFLKLDAFEEKRTIRTILKNSSLNGVLIDAAALSLIEKWKEHMAFTKEEAGIVLASLIERQKDYGCFFEKIKKDGKGIDIQPILKLMRMSDVERRAKAVGLITDIQDKDMINPLLLQLKKENVGEIKDLLIKGISRTGKKKAIIAAMNTLKEREETGLRAEAIEFLHAFLGENSYELLADIREIDENPAIIERIDQLLAKRAGSV